MNEKAVKYLKKTRPSRAASSVHYGNDFRFQKAEEQAKLKPVEIRQIISYINEFLNLLSEGPISPPLLISLKNSDFEEIKKDYNLQNNIQYASLKFTTKIDYKKIKKDYNLQDEKDIIWLKFTTKKYVGVVAKSNDIAFDVPPSKEDYHKKRGTKWEYTTSGIIIDFLNQKWDERFVLVFPLENIPQNLKRGDIETGIGNYLIDKGVPILDFYSHNY